MRRFAWIRKGNLPLHYELLCNGAPLGSLSWVQGSRSTAVAEMAGGVLVFRKEGLFLPHIVVETLREELVAKISLNPITHMGELRQPDGTRFSFTMKDTLQWTDADGNVLARIDDATGIGGIGSVTEAAAVGRSLPLTLLFAGWYLRVSMKRARASGAMPMAPEPLIRKPVGAL